MIKKFFMLIISIALTGGILFGAFKLFTFEKDKNELYPEVDITQVERLYTYLSNVDDENIDTMYNGHYIKFDNLSKSSSLATIYKYISNNYPEKVRSLTSEEIAKIGIHTSDVTPIGKIFSEDFLSVGKMIFGADADIKMIDFSLSGIVKGKYYEEDKSFYIYSINKASSLYYTAKNLTKYTIAENGNTLFIYDNYIRCNKSDKTCFNDSPMQIANKNITLNNSGTLNLEKVKDKLATYKHTFKLDNDKYYWYSSEYIKK